MSRFGLYSRLNHTVRCRIHRVMVRWAAVIVVSFCLAACAGAPTVTLPSIQARPLTELDRKQVKSGLCIAIDPITDPGRQQEYFGTEILAEGVLAVQVVVSNESENTAWYLPRYESHVNTGTGDYIPRVDPPVNFMPKSIEDQRKKVNSAVRRRQKMVIPSGVAIGLAPPLIIPIMAVYLKDTSKPWRDMSAIQMQLVDHGLPETAVPPGGSSSGLVLFYLKNVEVDELNSLTLIAEQLGTCVTESFVFRL